jgi:hypothetical protein
MNSNSSSISSLPVYTSPGPAPGLAHRVSESLALSEIPIVQERPAVRGDRNRNRRVAVDHQLWMHLGMQSDATERQCMDVVEAAIQEVHELRTRRDDLHQALSSLWGDIDIDTERSSLGTALASRVDAQIASQRTPERTRMLQGVYDKRTAAVFAEAALPLTFPAMSASGGTLPMSHGTQWAFGERSGPYHGIVALYGDFARHIDPHCPQMTAQMAGILDAQRIMSRKRGAKFLHVGHAILSKPKGVDGPVVPFEFDAIKRQADYFFSGIGLTRGCHDAAVFLHSDATRRANGQVKNEEAVHLLWCRARHDGMVHDIRFPWVAARVAQGRYDNYAGMDPERMGVSISYNGAMYLGIETLTRGRLRAQYRDPANVRAAETVALQGAEHRDRVALDGPPIPGDVTGLWIPKNGYRDYDDVVRLLGYLCGSDT